MFYCADNITHKIEILRLIKRFFGAYAKAINTIDLAADGLSRPPTSPGGRKTALFF